MNPDIPGHTRTYTEIPPAYPPNEFFAHSNVPGVQIYPGIPGHTTDIPRHTFGITAKICFVRLDAFGFRMNPDIPPTYPDISPAYPPKSVFEH